MAYKDVTRGNVVDIKKDEPEKVHHFGVYLGSKHITTNIGGQFIYSFKGEDNKKFGIWGFTVLNSLMENVEKGEMCRITYNGKGENQKGQPMHLCNVQVDDEFESSAESLDGEENPFNEDS